MLGHLPKTWDSIPLDCLTVHVLGGDWGKSADHDDPDYVRVRCIRASELRDWESEHGSTAALRKIKKSSLISRELRDGDIVVEVSGGGPEQPVGRTALINSTVLAKNPRHPKICTNFFRLLRPAREMNSSFLNLYLKFFYKTGKIAAYQGGSNNLRNLKFNDYLTISVPIPPVAEQSRIVSKIEELSAELDKGIESLKSARAKLNVYRQAVLKHAFEGKLTSQWREENKDKIETPEQLLARIKQEREARYEQQLQEWRTAVKKWEKGGKLGKRPARSRMPKPVSMMAEEEIAHLESLPSGWLWLTAESVGIVQLGRQRSPKNRSKDYPTKYIRAANITEQGLDLDDVLDMDFLPHELSAYRLEKGDLVLSEASGSAAQVGKPAIWDDQIPNCCFQNTVIRHQPYCRDYALYLLWLYRFFYMSGKFAQVAGGVGINHLSAFKFAQIALPLCSLAEQREIVRLLEERFAAIEQQEREIDSALKQAETLRQAILKKAFTGQLVAQDPNDEPASVLLDRIRTERKKAEQNNLSKKTKKRKATA